MYRFSQQIRLPNGWVARNSEILVLLPDGVTPATVYDEHGDPAVTPLLTNDEGVFLYWVYTTSPLFYQVKYGFGWTSPSPLDVGIRTVVENRDNVTTEGPAGANISVGQPVARNSLGAFILADCTVPGLEAVGLASTSALLGENVKVVTSGMVYLPSIVFPVNATLFLGQGQVEAATPSSSLASFQQTLGKVSLSAKIHVDISLPIYLT